MNLTRRRAQHRAAGMQEAERLTIYATALRSVAQAVRTGTCPAVLSRVTTRAHVERLVGVPSGPEAQPTTPSYPEDGPAPHEWQNDARDKRRRMFARMGIESAEQFERAVAALAALTGGHHDPEQEAKRRPHVSSGWSRAPGWRASATISAPRRTWSKPSSPAVACTAPAGASASWSRRPETARSWTLCASATPRPRS